MRQTEFQFYIKTAPSKIIKINLTLLLCRQITLAGEYQVAGTPALYERERDWEKVHIPGPIKEDILIYVSTYFSIFLSVFPYFKQLK